MLEVLKMFKFPFWRFWELCFMYLQKREGHLSLRLNFMFPHINLYYAFQWEDIEHLGEFLGL